jgi:hypothetical protein
MVNKGMHQASSNAIITANKQSDKSRSNSKHVVSLHRPYFHTPMFERVPVFAGAAAPAGAAACCARQLRFKEVNVKFSLLQSRSCVAGCESTDHEVSPAALPVSR